MDEFFDRLGGSDQDNFDLAALQYFEELDRQAGKEPFPAPRPEPAVPERTPPLPDEETMPDLADSGMDSVILSLMSEPAEKPAPARPAPGGRLTRPIPRKRAEAPAPAEKPADAPLSELARKAAALFDSLPTEDQLLAYSLLQKLARAAEKPR